MATETATRNQRKTRTGVVVSANADKTCVVRVENRKKHAIYSKMITTSKKLHTHDESNEANVGDTVMVMETRPLSKLKRWRLVEVIEKAK
ncbi:MAG: 30S ribosomal protein S17 [Actinomycetes bacterium]|jgi:small subunit ribosomal protein S17|nr:30S ribosomal protein S17 [Actinomycetes bacterium]